MGENVGARRAVPLHASTWCSDNHYFLDPASPDLPAQRATHDRSQQRQRATCGDTFGRHHRGRRRRCLEVVDLDGGWRTARLELERANARMPVADGAGRGRVILVDIPERAVVDRVHAHGRVVTPAWTQQERSTLT